MDGTFESLQSVLIDILQSLKMPIDDHVLTLVESERIKAKAIAFENIDVHILDTLSQLKKMGIKYRPH